MNLRRRWYAVYADALDVADQLMSTHQYGTPNWRTWTMTLEGACGNATRRFSCVSNISADDVRDLCHREWATWVADTLAPGRVIGLEDWTIAPPREPVRRPAPSADPIAHAKRVSRAQNRTRVLA